MPSNHYPVFPRDYYSPGTLESPEEITVYCSCKDWSYESIASAGGPCDTWWQDEYTAHIEDTETDNE